MTKKWMTVIAVLCLAALVFAACGKGGDNKETQPAGSVDGGEAAEQSGDTGAKDADTGKVDNGGNNPVVAIEMEDGGVIKVELYPDIAPNTVKSFISLANSGFYDGTIFHRVIPDFMIQGGDPNGNGTGGPGYRIPGEFTANGFQNDLSHTRGVISMGRLPTGYDTAGCQFFICVADCDWLDGQYASFGKVIEGMDVADAIVSAERDGSDKPYTDQVMKTVRVDTFGVDYGEPETIPGD
ncbi:MAG: peptidylprolyl isomerase [Clostridia bacterium]|nr:peptidylprolyl isomerase [Clostridia bacterium]